MRGTIHTGDGVFMTEPSFWLVMDQDGDGVAESVLPSHAPTNELAIVEALEHHEGRLMGVVHGDWNIDHEFLCLMCSAKPIRI